MARLPQGSGGLFRVAAVCLGVAIVALLLGLIPKAGAFLGLAVLAAVLAVFAFVAGIIASRTGR